MTCKDGRVEKGTHVVSTLPLSVLRDGVREIGLCLATGKTGPPFWRINYLEFVWNDFGAVKGVIDDS